MPRRSHTPLPSASSLHAGAASQRHGRFDVALAGGSTPKAAYELLGARPFCDAIDWTRVRFFFGDERCVPPDDDDSNYKMATHCVRSRHERGG